MQGWECPRCGKIHAPWVQECSCQKVEITVSHVFNISRTFDPQTLANAIEKRMLLKDRRIF